MKMRIGAERDETRPKQRVGARRLQMDRDVPDLPRKVLVRR